MKLNIQLFSGSCSIREITETTDIDTNASTFTITARLSRSGTTHNNDNAYMQLQWKYASSNDWTNLSKQSFGLPTSVSYRDRSWTLTLTHNADGTLENINFRVKWYITDSTNGTTGATTKTPTTIPRKSDIQSITSGTTDYAPTLTWTPASSTFKFIIRYLYGSWTYQTDWITPNSTNQQTFNSYTITGSSIAPYMTNTTTASVLASLYTYTSDGQLVGDSNVYFNVALNNNIEPSVSFNTPTEAGDTPSNWGVFVKTKSKLNLRLTASGIYGSTITGYRIEGNGYTYTDNPSVSNYLTTAGTIIFSGSVTDSRGRQKATSTSVNVEDYTNPTISTAQVQRCDENGNIDNNGEYCYISYGASISSCANKNKSNAHYKVGYRVHNSGSYTYISLASNVNSFSATGMLYTDGIYAANRGSGTKLELSNLNTYDIIFYVDDTFNTSGITNLQTLDTGFDLMNFNPSGKAMAIGKVSEAGANEELLEIGMNTKIEGGLSLTENIATAISMNNTNVLQKNTNGDTYIGSDGHNIVLRPNGNDTSNGQARLDANGKFWVSDIELSTATPYIDFHFNNSSADYTSRIIEESSGLLALTGSLIAYGGIYGNHISGITSSTDYNNLVTSGYHTQNDVSGAANAPTTNNGLLMVIAIRSNTALVHIVQVFMDYNGHMWFRLKWFNVFWAAWKQIT